MSDYHVIVDTLQSNQETLQNNVAPLKQEVKDVQPVSYYGTFRWKMSKVANKIGKIYIDFLSRSDKGCYYQNLVKMHMDKSLHCSFYFMFQRLISNESLFRH